MTDLRSGMPALLASSALRRSARRLGWSVAASVLVAAPLVPASAQTFNLNGATVTITNFTDPPANNPAVITNGVLIVNNPDFRINIFPTTTPIPNLRFDGVLSDVGGALTLQTQGVLNLTLSGANSHSGGTNLNGGNAVASTTLVLANDSALGTGSLTLAGTNPTLGIATNAGRTTNTDTVLVGNNIVLALPGIAVGTRGSANLDVGAGLTMISTGNISGEGSIVKTGAGLLVLNGAISGTNGLFLGAGTIRTGNNSALGGSGLGMRAGTILQNGATGVTLPVFLSLGGAVTIDTQQFDYTLNGVLFDVSALSSITKIGSANLTLGGMNQHALGTALNQGAITVATDSALGRGALTMANGTTLRTAVNAGRATNAENVVVTNAITTAGAGTISTATGLTLITSTGVISGAGSLVKTGDGLLVLNGANTYSGGTSLNGGTIRVGNNAAFGTGAVTAAARTMVQAGLPGVNLATNFALNGEMLVDNHGIGLALSGVISGSGGLSAIDTRGSRTNMLTLSGTNSHSGGTLIDGTTVAVSRNENLGAAAGGLALIGGGTLRTTASLVTDRAIRLGTEEDFLVSLGAGGGRLAIGQGTTLTINGVISGGALTVNGGELVLNGANSYSGVTRLIGGTIVIANDAALGTGSLFRLDGGTLRTTASFATSRTLALGDVGGTISIASGTTLTASGMVVGTALTVNGGELVLNGSNSYNGGTTLRTGTITVANDQALGAGTLTMVAGTTLNVATNLGRPTNTDNVALANAISTAGAATINTGAGLTLFLNGIVSGAGSITKIGSGALVLGGQNSFAGGTTVAAGTLNVTGALASGVTVASGALLAGTGRIGSLNVQAGGTVNPGASGTADMVNLAVAGAVILGGTYTANIAPTANDSITAGGAVTLGGTLAVVPVAGTPLIQFNQSFTLASGASLTGTFATVTGLEGSAFTPVMTYTATGASLRLAPQSMEALGNGIGDVRSASVDGLGGRPGGLSGNALEVARAFDRAVAAGYNPQSFFTVYASSGSALTTTLRQMSGEQRAAERRVVLEGSRVVRESALDRLNAGVASLGGQQVSSSDGDRVLTFWLRGAGSWGTAQSSGAATGFTTDQRGVLTGLDWAKDGLTIGGMFHFTSTDIDYRELAGSSTVESVGGTIYGGYRRDGGVVVNGGVSVSGARTSGSRAITLAGFAQSLPGTTTGSSYQFFGEAAYDLAASADRRIEPFARVAHVRADIGGLTETGGVAALAAAKQGHDITVINLGGRVGANIAGGKAALNAGASWQGTSGDRDAATVIGIPALGQNGLIRTVQIDRSALSLQADAAVALSPAIRFSLGYSGLIGQRNSDHGGRATLMVAF